MPAPRSDTIGCIYSDHEDTDIVRIPGQLFVAGEEVTPGGGGGADLTDYEGEVISLTATDGGLSLLAPDEAAGIITVTGQLGVVITASQDGGTLILSADENLSNLTLTESSITITCGEDGSAVEMSPSLVDIRTLTEEGQVTISAAGPNGNVVLDAEDGFVTVSAANIGFFDAGPAPQPVVPLTTPSVQDVIDALVLLGLVSQSD